MASRNQTTKQKEGFFQKNNSEFTLWNRIVLFILAGATSVFSFLLMIGSFQFYSLKNTIVPYSFGASLLFAIVAFAALFIRREKTRGTKNNQVSVNEAKSKPKRMSSKIPKEYRVILKTLENTQSDAKERYNHVEALIQEYFGDSKISVSRYTDVLTKANEVLEQNYQQANKAVQLFGTSKPTEARLEILNHYVHDSQDILAKIDQIIDELIRVHQSASFDEGDVLDERLDELVQTTHFYAQKNEQNQ